MNTVVLGMHRSGTSLCAGLLHAAGASLPAELVPADEHNAKGYFEPWRMTVFNDECLERRGARWDDVFAVERLEAVRGFTVEETSRAEVFSKGLAGGRDLVLKDPRLSLLLPLWREVADFRDLDARHVIMVRRPAAVAASLARRDRMPRSYALLLWAVYLLAAERNTRGLPRVFVNYDDLLSAPEAQLERMGPPVPPADRPAVRAFADPQLRHDPADADAFGADDAIRSLIQPVWEWAASAASSPRPEPPPAALTAAVNQHLRSNATPLRETQTLLVDLLRESRRAEAAEQALHAALGRAAAEAAQQRDEAALLAPELARMLQLTEAVTELMRGRELLEQEAAQARYWRRLTLQAETELEALASARRSRTGT